MTTVSRAEYLKKYTTNSSEKPKKSKSKTKKSTNSNVGMRLLDEDTFIRSKPGTTIRLLNRKAEQTRKNKKEVEAPVFKSDGFVVIQGPPDDPDEEKSPNSVPISKKEIKEEINEENIDQEEPSKKRRKMDDGRKAGLLSKEVAKEEIQKMRERDQKEKAQADEQGRDAETRKRVTGIAQIKEREEKLDEMEQVLGEGFTRHRDDEALNEHLKTQLHSEDPMAEYFRVKNHKIQMRTGIVYPTYKGQCPPNRYEIKPGYRWDGVDRSNGFESKMSLEKNKKIAHKELTYRSIAECE
uniref:BUD13 homolog n=1 Tax=Meloidogyne javanica TaxID=6303 RepID=A0A915M783_MELJA